jgi:hypothetical protein
LSDLFAYVVMAVCAAGAAAVVTALAGAVWLHRREKRGRW